MDRPRTQGAGSDLISPRRPFLHDNCDFATAASRSRVALPFPKAASAGLGNGILPPETGGHFGPAQRTEVRELALADRTSPWQAVVMTTVSRNRETTAALADWVVGDPRIELMAIAAWHPSKRHRRRENFGLAPTGFRRRREPSRTWHVRSGANHRSMSHAVCLCGRSAPWLEVPSSLLWVTAVRLLTPRCGFRT
jgi:hypothetical protein